MAVINILQFFSSFLFRRSFLVVSYLLAYNTSCGFTCKRICVYVLFCALNHMQCLLDDDLCAATSTFDIRFCVCDGRLFGCFLCFVATFLQIFIWEHHHHIFVRISCIRAFWSQYVHVLFISFFIIELHFSIAILFSFVRLSLTSNIPLTIAAVLNLYFCVSMCVCTIFPTDSPAPYLCG